jgi:hypothetical protein
MPTAVAILPAKARSSVNKMKLGRLSEWYRDSRSYQLIPNFDARFGPLSRSASAIARNLKECAQP